MLLFNQLAKLLGAKKLPFGIGTLRDAVRMKNQYIARLQNAIPFVVIHFFKDSQWESGQLYFFAVTIFVKQWLRLPGVRNAQFSFDLLPGCKTRGHEAAFDTPLANDLIHLLEDVRGLQFLRRQTTHDADGHGAVERCSRAFTAHVAKSYAKLLGPIAQEFIQIATHFPS